MTNLRFEPLGKEGATIAGLTNFRALEAESICKLGTGLGVFLGLGFKEKCFP